MKLKSKKIKSAMDAILDHEQRLIALEKQAIFKLHTLTVWRADKKRQNKVTWKAKNI